MSAIKVLVVEDEIVVSMLIEDLLSELGYDVLEASSTYEMAINSLDNDKPDIALLDIELASEKTGIDVAQYIVEHIHIPFIFLTSKADPRTVNRVKQLNPPAYLVKPFTQEALYASIELALFNFKPLNNPEEERQNVIIKDSFFVKGTNRFHKVKLSEILFAKSDHVYVQVYTNDGKCHLIRSSMNSFIEDLPINFFRVHRSYTVNLDHLKAINSTCLFINDHEIPIGANYRSLVMQQINVK